MKTLLFMLMTCCTFNVLAAEIVIHNMLDNTLEIELPDNVDALDEDRIASQYSGSSLMPKHVFINKQAEATFTVTQVNTPASRDSMPNIHKSLSAMYHKAHPDAKWKKDKLYTRLGTKVAAFEYEIKGIAQNQYFLTYSFPVEGKLVLVSFVVSNKKYISKWKGIAKEAFDSLVIL